MQENLQIHFINFHNKENKNLKIIYILRKYLYFIDIPKF